MTPHIILLLAANPLGTDRRALDCEARAIQVELGRSGCRDRFELVTRWAAEPLDLLRELRVFAPTVVHFSGLGIEREHGLVFHGIDGRARCVSAAALTQTFNAAGASVRLAVLSACFTEVQAVALAASVDCVVGMGGSIGDDAARSFAIGLYGGLGARASVATAFAQGCAAIHLEGLDEHVRPRLKLRTGVDANQLVLAEQSSRRHGRAQSAAAIAASHGSVAARSITSSIVIAGAHLAPDEGDEH